MVLLNLICESALTKGGDKKNSWARLRLVKGGLGKKPLRRRDILRMTKLTRGKPVGFTSHTWLMNDGLVGRKKARGSKVKNSKIK